MTREIFIAFAVTQVWQVPFLIVYVVGLILALSNRGLGRASNFAAIGFGALALSWSLGALQQYIFFRMRFSDSNDIAAISRTALLFFVPNMVLHLGGLGLVLAAIFVKRPAPPSGL